MGRGGTKSNRGCTGCSKKNYKPRNVEVEMGEQNNLKNKCLGGGGEMRETL